MQFHLDQSYVSNLSKEVASNPKFAPLKAMQRIWQPFYDHKIMNTAGIQTFMAGSNGRSRLFTNFDGANQLDNPRHFLLCGLSFHVDAGTPAVNVAALVNNSHFGLTIGDVPYIDLPLAVVAADQSADIADPGEGAGIVAWGKTSSGTGDYILPDPIMLAPGKNFKPTVTLETALPAAVGLRLVMHGFVFRR